MRRLLDPGIRHEWDVALVHGATPEHQSVIDLSLVYDAFGIRTRWVHTPHGLEWATSAVRLPGTGWTRTRLSQAVRLASQQPAVHHLVRGQQRCALYLWTHRGALRLLLAGGGVSPVSETYPDRDAGHGAATDHFTHLIAHGWRPAPPLRWGAPGGLDLDLDLDRSSAHG
jgi:hypothetical protein